MHASNVDRFEHSIREVADVLKIAGRNDPKVNVFRLVEAWLRDETKGKWTIVLDEADTANLLLDVPVSSRDNIGDAATEVSRKPFFKYLPLCSHGSVIITSRNKELALALVDENDVVSIPPMDEEHATALLTKKLGNQANSNKIGKLAAELEYMPLAIVQACAYIKQRGSRCSVERYLDKFQTSDKSKVSLLEAEAGSLYRDWEAKNSIITTWQISFNHIRQIRPTAADRLSLMSFFDRQGIPEYLLSIQHDEEESEGEENEDQNSDSDADLALQSDNSADEDLEDDIQTLCSYEFISTTGDGTIFEMHRLVQLATRRWLEMQGQLERWKAQSVYNLDFFMPSRQFENWARCQVLFPHIKCIAKLQLQESSAFLQRSWLILKAAQYANDKGSSTDAEALARLCIETKLEELGKYGVSVLLHSYNILTLAIKSTGRYQDAERLEQQVLETVREDLGENHPDTLTIMNNLAMTYYDQGRYEEAEKLQKQAFQIRREVVGETHLHTQISRSNLASIYTEQGQYEEAEKLHKQVFRIEREVLGETHPRTLVSINNLATTYFQQGRFEEAEKLHKQVFRIRREVLGETHPRTLVSINNLATTYFQQGRFEEAEKL